MITRLPQARVGFMKNLLNLTGVPLLVKAEGGDVAIGPSGHAYLNVMEEPTMLMSDGAPIAVVAARQMVVGLPEPGDDVLIVARETRDVFPNRRDLWSVERALPGHHQEVMRNVVGDKIEFNHQEHLRPV